MKERIINSVLELMQRNLNNYQMVQLKQALVLCLPESIKTEMNEYFADGADNEGLLHRFINAKRVEGCSEKTIRYYETTVKKMMTVMNKSVVQVTTEDIRNYLSGYR